MGFVMMLVVLQILIGQQRLAVAGDRATAAAQTAAIWAARSGSTAQAESFAADLAPGSDVEAWRDGDTVFVEVHRSVAVIGPSSSPLRYTVIGRGAAAVAPYRSDG